jgi:hypothetical protein
MWITRSAAAALLVMMTGLPAMAQDIEIATLGRAPIMGSSRDSAELKRNFENPTNQRILAQAGHKLGLTANEYGKFKEQVAIGNASWMPIPRHLDKMTWAADGTVHVISGVHIPAGQMGYRVLVPKDDGSGSYLVYLPAKCGNLSYVFQPQQRVAAVPPPVFPKPHPLVAAAQNFPAPQPPPLVAATGVSGTTPQVSPIPPPPIPVVHHLNLLPLAALVPFLFNGGGGSVIPPPSGGTVVGPPPCP